MAFIFNEQAFQDVLQNWKNVPFNVKFRLDTRKCVYAHREFLKAASSVFNRGLIKFLFKFIVALYLY